MTHKTKLLSMVFGLALGCRAAGSGESGEGEHGEHGEEGEHQGEIVLDEHVIERNGITTEVAQRRLLLGSLEVPAEVQVNPDKTAHVSSLIPGRLAEIRAALGDQIDKGEVLAIVRSVELGRARGELVAARARNKAAKAELKRMKTLVAEGIAAKKLEVEAQARADQTEANVIAARAALSVYGVGEGSGPTLALHSSIDGTVIERHASPGEIVDSQTSSFVVADLSQLWVIGRVYEQDLTKVAEGIPAEVVLIAYPGRIWPGVVDYVASTLDEDTRTVSIRVVLDNPEGILRPGMFGTIALGARDAGADGSQPKTLTVPDTAIVSLGDRTVVFVVGDEPGAYLPRDVVTGSSAHGFVEIREGLEPGEAVVNHGAFVLKSEVLKGSIGEGHEH